MFLKTHNAAEAVKLCEAGVRFCDKIRTFNIAQVFASFLFKLFYIQWLYFLALSLVFVCRENSRRSGILLFPNRPRFCRLMKTRNRRYRRSSGMNGDKSGESGAFLFTRRVPDFCDGRRSFPTKENSNLYHWGDVGVRRRWISLITNPLNCWALVPLSQINVAFLENLGKTSAEYLRWSEKSKIPDRLGFSRHMKTRL